MSEEILSRIQIHEKADGYKIASIQGLHSPVAILEDDLLDELYVQCEKAKVQLEAGPIENNDAILFVFEKLIKILGAYSTTRNRYYSGLGPKREDKSEEKDALAQLEHALKQIEDINDPNK